MKLESLEKLFVDELKDIYSAESQLVKALPKMHKKASNPKLKEAIASHLEETKTQKERLEQIGEMLGVKLTGKKCAAMEGLIEEGKEVLEADGSAAVIDAAIISCAQRVEHYEISAYGTTRSLARHLGHTKAVALLEATIKEEGAADHKLTEIAEGAIYPSVGQEEDAPVAKAAAKNGKPKVKKAAARK